MFSVVVPLYNKELSIKNTIQSVLDQTYQDFEIVVVNDGSTDSSPIIIEEFKDSRIRLIHQKNHGVSAARNKGIKEAECQWIVFLDADDIWKNNHLSVLANMIKKYPEDKVFCTSHTKSKPRNIEEESGLIVVIENYFREVLQHVDFFWTSATCIHVSVFENVGDFVVGINRGEDLDLWARIGREYRFIRSTKLTAVYRTDSENKLTSKRPKFQKSILNIIQLKGLKGDERKYYKQKIYQRMKSNVKYMELNDLFRTILRFNIELIK